MGDSLVFLHVVFGHGVARCFELGKISEISAKNGILIITRHDVHVYVYVCIYTEYMYTYTCIRTRTYVRNFSGSRFRRLAGFRRFPRKMVPLRQTVQKVHNLGVFGEILTVIPMGFYALFPKFGRPFFCVFFQGFRRAKKINKK